MRLLTALLLSSLPGLLMTCFVSHPDTPQTQSLEVAGGEPNSVAARVMLRSAADSLPQLLRRQLAGPLRLPEAGVVQRFYQTRQQAPAWLRDARPTPAATEALQLLAGAADYGLSPTRYHWPALAPLRDSLLQAGLTPTLPQQLRFELLLTDGLLRLLTHLRRGQLHAATPSPLESAARPFDPATWLGAALAAPALRPALLRCQPPQREYQQLQQALAAERARPAGPDSLRHRQREQLMALNLERWRWQAIPDSEYALVNLPAYELEVVRHRRVVQTHRLVIGRPGSPTPTLSSRISSFTIAPAWHVPKSIAVNEILPYLRVDPDFAAVNNYTILDQQGQLIDPSQVNWQRVSARNFPYTIRQNPGCGNALGNVLFFFANPYGIYLHDTGAREDFSHPYRALGHGCLRLQQPMQLASFLLGREGQAADLPTEEECELSPASQHFSLKHPLPLHVRYATAAVVNGQLRTYPDVYRRDETLRRQLFGPTAGAGPRDRLSESF